MKGSSCMGLLARRMGQSRVPDPPEMIMLYIAELFCANEGRYNCVLIRKSPDCGLCRTIERLSHSDYLNTNIQ